MPSSRSEEPDAVHHADGGILGGGGGLRDGYAPLAIHGHEIGEGAADIHADAVHVSALRSSGRARRRSSRHEAVLDVRGAGGRGAPRRLAPAAAARGHDVEDGARRNGNADFLGLEDAPLAAGHEDVAVGQAVLAAQDAVGGMADSIARRVALGRLGRLHAESEHGAHPAAKLAVTERIGPELVPSRRRAGSAPPRPPRCRT